MDHQVIYVEANQFRANTQKLVKIWREMSAEGYQLVAVSPCTGQRDEAGRTEVGTVGLWLFFAEPDQQSLAVKTLEEAAEERA